MASQKLLLSASSAFFLFSLVSAQGPFGFGDGGGNGNGNGNGGGPPWAQGENGNNTFGCAWWGGSDCDGNGGSNGGSNNNDSGNNAGSTLAAYGLSTSEYSKTNSIVTAHAVIACLVWVFLIPSGGILLRLPISSPWLVRAHAILQTLSYILYIVAVGLGVWLVRQLSYGGFVLWSDPHPKLGVAILALAFLQPILGFIHHRTYKKRVAEVKSGRPTKAPGRTTFAYVHIWLGRVLIVAGMVAGGLGLRLAGNSPFASNQKAKVIAYSVGAVVMFILYVLFVVLGERRRAKSIRDQRQGVNYNEVPLEDRSVPPPAYNNPPTYQQSESSGRKQAQTTARYS